MEEPFKKQDEMIDDLMKGLPLEKPSRDFSKKVMHHIEKKTSKTAYRPLIPKAVWWSLGILFALGVYWIYLNPSSSLVDLEAYSLPDAISLKNRLEGIHFPKTVLYAIGFMALFLIQIPFLKRMMEKSYS